MYYSNVFKSGYLYMILNVILNLFDKILTVIIILFHTLGKKERVVIKRRFYRVTVINVKHRGKFCFPN